MQRIVSMAGLRGQRIFGFVFDSSNLYL